jgi:hypothetical protein
MGLSILFAAKLSERQGWWYTITISLVPQQEWPLHERTYRSEHCTDNLGERDLL